MNILRGRAGFAGGGVILLGVFLLCMCVGVIAGNYIKSQVGIADAVSTNITVVNNNQISTIDQGTPTITRTSTVTIKDPTATLGYKLSAQISQNTITGSSASIYSTTSTTCTQSSPCTLNSSTPTEILETTNTASTQPQGHTTTWTVTITMPTNTPQGNYILDIAYNEDPILLPPGPPEPNPSNPTTYGAMQKMTNTECSTTRGTAFDARNGQTYYVQKIGNLCWMETNLRYAGNGDWNASWNYPDDRYATSSPNTTANTNDDTRPLSTIANGYLGGSQANQYTMAGYFDPNGSTDYTNTAASGGFYGYLYNWCSAMGGQANACNNTSTTGFDTTTPICPAGWRLPTGGTGGEFQTMANAIGVTNDATGSTNFRNNFLAVYSGNYHNALNLQGSVGYFWSSTVGAATYAYYLSFGAGSVNPADTSDKYSGRSVRCVM